MFFRQRAACPALSMQEAKQALTTDKSIRLLDVRTEAEYRDGHIPASLNLPLNRLLEISRLVPDKNTPLFVYCLSGGRSQQACMQLSSMGYAKVTNIGGISQWTGSLEKAVGV